MILHFQTTTCAQTGHCAVPYFFLVDYKERPNPFQCSVCETEMELVCNFVFVSKRGGEGRIGSTVASVNVWSVIRALMFLGLIYICIQGSNVTLNFQAPVWMTLWERCPSMWRFSLIRTLESTKSQSKVKAKTMLSSFWKLNQEVNLTLGVIVSQKIKIVANQVILIVSTAFKWSPPP